MTPYPFKKLCYGTAFLLILATCGVAPKELELTNQVITVAQSNQQFFSLGQLEQISLEREGQAHAFTISPTADPMFALYRGSTSDGDIVIQSRMMRSNTPEFTLIRITGDPSSPVRLSSPNWQELASQKVRLVVADFINRCERLPKWQAYKRYGAPGYFDVTLGTTIEVSDGFSSCKQTIDARSYAIVISTEMSSVLVSNINGQIFLEEIVP